MVRPCSTSATMLVNPGCVRTTLAAPLATSVAVLTAMPTSACRSAGASLTPSPVMPVTCPAACRCFTTIYLSSGNTSAKPSAPPKRSTVPLPACALAALRAATRRTWANPPPSAADLAARGRRVTGQHLHRPPALLERGDELPGVRSRRIVQRHQSYQGRCARLGAACHRQRPIALRGRRARTSLQRLDCRGFQSAGLGDGAHGAFHHAQPLPVLL